MALAQFLQARVAPDLEAFVEHDAAGLQPIDAAHHDRLLQLEAGDAVGQQPAGAVVAVVDMDVIAGDAEQIRRRSARPAPRR